MRFIYVAEWKTLRGCNFLKWAYVILIASNEAQVEIL